MSQFHPIAERVLLPAEEFFLGVAWELQAGTRLTASRVEGLQKSAGTLLAESVGEALSDLVAEHFELSRDVVRTETEWSATAWQSPPLELTFAVRATSLIAAWQERGPKAADLDQVDRARDRLEDQLRECAAAAGEAIASISPRLHFKTAWARRIPAGQAELGDGHVRAVDLQAVRSHQVPIEHALLLDSVISAAGQMLTLADVLGIARSQSIEDEDVLSGMNFYIDKGYLAFDRTHQVLRLTPHGREASTNPLRDTQL